MIVLGLLSWLLGGQPHDGWDPRRDVVNSGEFVLCEVRSNATILVRATSGGRESSRVAVGFLGIKVRDVPVAVGLMREWFGTSVRLRFDRRRLDADRQLQAYVYADDLFVNAALVRSGAAVPATHPSDVGPLRREILQAHWPAGFEK